MRMILVAALLAGTASAPAFAQDAAPFSGPRVEGLIGYDSIRSGDRDDDGVDTGEDEGDESIDGVGFGVGVGYDFNLGGVVAGVEGEFMESSGKQDIDETIDGVAVTGGIETGRDLYVGARVGVPVTPNTLIYAKGGYTNTGIESRLEDGTESLELDSNVDGWRLGAGVEHQFGTNLYGKVEYRYSNYDTLDISDDEDFETAIDLDRHQVVAGIGWRF